MTADDRTPTPATPSGRLEWRTLLKWLREDRLVNAEDAERTGKRFAAGDSAQHPLVRLGAAGPSRKGSGKTLDTEALTEWLAGRCGLPELTEIGSKRCHDLAGEDWVRENWR